MRRTLRLIAPVVVAAALAACTSSSSGSSASPSAASGAQVCADLSSLQTSVKGLLNVNVIQSGTDGIKAALTPVQSDVDALAGSASAEFGPEVDALKQALAAVTTTLSSGQSITQMAGQLSTQLPAVGTAWTNLTTATSSLNCDLSST